MVAPRRKIAGKTVPRPVPDTVPLGPTDARVGSTICGEDLINQPPHYASLSDLDVECLDAQEAAIGPEAFVDHVRATIMGYTWRCTRKGDALEDAKKIQFYANLLVRKLEE